MPNEPIDTWDLASYAWNVDREALESFAATIDITRDLDFDTLIRFIEALGQAAPVDVRDASAADQLLASHFKRARDITALAWRLEARDDTDTPVTLDRHLAALSARFLCEWSYLGPVRHGTAVMARLVVHFTLLRYGVHGNLSSYEQLIDPVEPSDDPSLDAWLDHNLTRYIAGRISAIDRGPIETKAEQPLEGLRPQRRAGDPRLTDSDKEILRRITMGDLAEEFGASLAAISDADPLVGGGRDPDDD